MLPIIRLLGSHASVQISRDKQRAPLAMWGDGDGQLEVRLQSTVYVGEKKFVVKI